MVSNRWTCVDSHATVDGNFPLLWLRDWDVSSYGQELAFPLNSQKEADGGRFHSFCPLALLPRDQFGMCSVGFGFPGSDVA